MKWKENNSLAKKDQNGPINPRTWGIQTITGGVLTKGCDYGKRMSRLDYFLVMFLPAQLIQCTILTNRVLKKIEGDKNGGNFKIFFYYNFNFKIWIL